MARISGWLPKCSAKKRTLALRRTSTASEWCCGSYLPTKYPSKTTCLHKLKGLLVGMTALRLPHRLKGIPSSFESWSNVLKKILRSDPRSYRYWIFSKSTKRKSSQSRRLWCHTQEELICLSISFESLQSSIEWLELDCLARELTLPQLGGELLLPH